ncbi:MAG: SGNH/GDSL hydrolase family protein [Deltaproteobacteria bacterium]|nr:SGNH/GDSL hydrolase family protein [Deltaproteobacteria bacterium]
MRGLALGLFVTVALAASGCEKTEDTGSSSGTSGASGSGSSSGTSGSTSSSTSGEPPPVSTKDGGVDPTSGEIRYLSIGDSLTQGIGAPNPETEAFPAKLAERWRAKGCKVELSNVGISGYTAGEMLRDQVPQIAPFKPTFITFQSGANDIANSVTPEAYRTNVRAVIDAAKKSGARVVVLLQNEWFRAPAGPGYGGTPEKRAAFDAIMLEEIARASVELVDLRLLYKQQADANQWVSDGIHPTAAAYDAWANELARVIPAPCGK